MQCLFPISKCPAFPCTPFENQSSQVQLITLKATYLPTFCKWGWICYQHRVIFNLKHYQTQMIHSKIRTTFTHVLAQNRWNYKLLGYTNLLLSLFSLFFFFLSCSSSCCTRLSIFCSMSMYPVMLLIFQFDWNCCQCDFGWGQTCVWWYSMSCRTYCSPLTPPGPSLLFLQPQNFQLFPQPSHPWFSLVVGPSFCLPQWLQFHMPHVLLAFSFR